MLTNANKYQDILTKGNNKNQQKVTNGNKVNKR